MAERKVVFDPTLAAVEAIFFGDEMRFHRSPSMKTLPASLTDSWRDYLTTMAWSADDYRRAKLQFGKAIELTGRMHRAGVPVVAGTDLSMPWVIPGESLHRELELLVQAGLSPMEAIAAATSRAARALKLDQQVGVIAAGRRADLVVLNGNPAANIAATRSILMVLQGGREIEK